MSVTDLWKGLPKAEIARRRQKNLDRYVRRWRDGKGASAPQRTQGYKETQKAQAFLDDAAQRANPRVRALRTSSLTVGTLLDRHLATKADRSHKTIETDAYHAGAVRRQFGERVLSSLERTEIAAWAAREGVAAESRKKQVEILRAAITDGIKDKLLDEDPTEGIIVPLGHKELPHWSLAELLCVITAARDGADRALIMVLGLMGLRRGEALSLTVGDLRLNGVDEDLSATLVVKNSGASSDKTKTRASRRVLPVPAPVLPALAALAGERPKSAWLFESTRKPGQPFAPTYPNQALTRAVARANLARATDDRIDRINVHGLRHTFAAVTLSEAGADLFSVSKAMGHARPSITLDRYGHFAPNGLATLMGKVADLVTVSGVSFAAQSPRKAASAEREVA